MVGIISPEYAKKQYEEQQIQNFNKLVEDAVQHGKNCVVIEFLNTEDIQKFVDAGWDIDVANNRAYVNIRESFHHHFTTIQNK